MAKSKGISTFAKMKKETYQSQKAFAGEKKPSRGAARSSAVSMAAATMPA